ncbi:hypothetical protein D3C87_2034470 [compost metagenome]
MTSVQEQIIDLRRTKQRIAVRSSWAQTTPQLSLGVVANSREQSLGSLGHVAKIFLRNSHVIAGEFSRGGQAQAIP